MWSISNVSILSETIHVQEKQHCGGSRVVNPGGSNIWRHSILTGAIFQEGVCKWASNHSSKQKREKLFCTSFGARQLTPAPYAPGSHSPVPRPHSHWSPVPDPQPPFPGHQPQPLALGPTRDVPLVTALCSHSGVGPRYKFSVSVARARSGRRGRGPADKRRPGSAGTSGSCTGPRARSRAGLLDAMVSLEKRTGSSVLCAAELHHHKPIQYTRSKIIFCEERGALRCVTQCWLVPSPSTMLSAGATAVLKMHVRREEHHLVLH